MKYLALGILVLILFQDTLQSQTQLSVMGAPNANDTLIVGKVIYNGNEDVIGLYIMAQYSPDIFVMKGIGAKITGGTLGIETKGTTGILATGSSPGTGIGVHGKSISPGGFGILGEGFGGCVGVKGTSIGNHGVIGETTSENDQAGYFTGGRGLYASPSIGVNNEDPQHPIEVGIKGSGVGGNGAHVSKDGQWTSTSSFFTKNHIVQLDYQDVLKKINSLQITSWQYKNSEGQRHIGPFAEEFYEFFKLGDDPTSISTMDMSGVALAGIKGLYKENQILKEEIYKLQKLVSQLISER